MATKNAETEQQYHEKLNIPVLTISRIKHVIKNDIKNTLSVWDAGKDVNRQCFHIIGPAGVGKTEICWQIADELSEETKMDFEMIMVKAPVLSRDDFIVPFPVIDKENKAADFKMLYSDFVPKDED